MGLLGQLLEQKIENQHQDDEYRKQQLRSFYLGRITDPNTDPAVRDQITPEYLKLLSPDAKKTAQNGIGVLGKLQAAFKGGPQQQQPAQGSDQQTPQQSAPAPSIPAPVPAPASREQGIPTVTDAAAPTDGPPQTPRAQFAAGPPAVAPPPAPTAPQFFQNYGKAELGRKLALETQEQEFWKQRGVDLGLKSRDLAEYAGTKGTKLPAVQRGALAMRQQAQEVVDDPDAADSDKTAAQGFLDSLVKADPKTTVGVDLKDGTHMLALRSKDGKYSTLDGSSIDPSTIKGETPKASSARPTVLSSDYVNLDNAHELAATGFPFNDHNGKPIDLSTIPKGMVLQAIRPPDGNTYYSPRNINDKVVTVGNQVIAVNPSQVQQIPEGGGTTLGQARTGTANTPTQVVTDDQGVPHVLGSTTNPNTPGPVRAPSTAPSPSQAPASAPGRTAPVAAPGGPRPMAGVPLGMYNQALGVARPVREAATQIIPMVKYAKLADDPGATQRVGTAVKMMLGDLEGATGGANVHAGVGPVAVSTGGFGEWLQNYFNIPPKLAAQKNQMMADAIKAMDGHPDEIEAFDATMKAFEAAVGMRSLTKASAAQGSIATIQKTLPLIGINSFSSRQYMDQMKKWKTDISNGSWGIPPNLIGKDVLKQIDDADKEVGPAKAPAKKISTGDSVADEYLKKHPELVH